ncbi:CDP-alcohol phosphatidyltransferase family protein [Novipirellula caenicola]|uniref:CDP-diacylglycerol--glycerol-3-phosphate 1-phosphatidyltransferase n=1 Tax=Novipirellula caenicola TaxID=1536901 RepID=A0ABP9VHM0_9BACT
MSPTASSKAVSVPRPPDRWATLPNALCVIRFIGSWVMVGVAVAGLPHWVVGMFLFLAATDWVDGKLAILLDQRSSIGPKIDTIADVTLYACLLLSLVYLRSDLLLQEAGWIGLAVLSYAGSCGFSLLKFKRFPSYHTRAAKTCWLLMIVGVIAVFLQWSTWPLRIAMLGVTLTNIEAMLITATLKQPESDIRSFRQARRQRHRLTP